MNDVGKKIFIIAFLLMIALPLAVGAVTGPDQEALHREPEQLPDFRGINYIGDYEGYLSDRLAFKGEMIEAANMIDILLLKDYSGKDVVYGQQGYMFFAPDYIREDMLGERVLEEETLEQICENQFAVASRLRQMGIKYMIAVVPDKHSIYYDYLPYGMYLPSDNRQKDQIINRLKENPDIIILDMQDAFLRHKNEAPLYLKTDGHWNDNGAFLGYTQIIQKLKETGFEQIPILEIEDYNIFLQDGPAGNLARLLQLENVLTEEASYIYEKKTPASVQQATIEGYEDPSIYPIEAGYGMLAYEKKQKGTLPKAIILKDSFGGTPQTTYGDVDFLAESFERAVFLSTSAVDFNIIEKEQPDIVIVQVAEYLMSGRLNLPYSG